MSTLNRLYELIDEIEIAMMTTRRADGHLRSRAMATQKAASGADLWFVTRKGADKLPEIANDPHQPVVLQEQQHPVDFGLGRSVCLGTEADLGEMHRFNRPHRPTA